MIRPLYLDTYYDDDKYYHMECESANIFAVGDTVENAKEDFLEELRYAWETYVLGDPTNFHESALKYREWLMNNIQRQDHGSAAQGV